jgi:hypothetical protein
MQDTKRIWVWVGVAVVVIAVAVAFIWKPNFSKPATSTNTTPPPVTYAAQGQIVPQFPKQLILDGLASVGSSYSIGYSSSTNQYTAVFNASTSMAILYYSYKQYFLANRYGIVNDITKYPTSRGLDAVNASSEVAVAIVQKGTGSQTTITYVTK